VAVKRLALSGLVVHVAFLCSGCYSSRRVDGSGANTTHLSARDVLSKVASAIFLDSLGNLKMLFRGLMAMLENDFCCDRSALPGYLGIAEGAGLPFGQNAVNHGECCITRFPFCQWDGRNAAHLLVEGLHLGR